MEFSIALWKRARFFLIPYTAWVALMAALLLVWGRDGFFLYINQHWVSPTWHSVFLVGNLLGEGWTTALACTAISLWAWYAKKGWKWPLMAWIAFAFTGIYTHVFKKWVFPGAPRPKTWFAEQGQALNFVPGVDVHAHNSFPSGHTLTAFALFFLLTLLLPKRGWGWLFLGLASLAGFSRIYLAQHFPTDVFFGSFLGISSVLCSLYLIKPPMDSSFTGRA